MEEFVEAIQVFQHLYREKSDSQDCLFIIRFHFDENDKQLGITVTDLSDMWEHRMSFNEFKKMKCDLDLIDESWEQFFNILYEGIMADSIYIKDRGNYIKIAIEGYFNGEPITFQFRLFSVEYPECKIVNFMIGMTRKIQEYQKIQRNYNDLRKKMATLQTYSNSMQTQGTFSFDNDNMGMDFIESKPVVSNLIPKKKNTYHLKRKPGYSIVNPHSKRRIARGAKIGEE